MTRSMPPRFQQTIRHFPNHHDEVPRHASRNLVEASTNSQKTNTATPKEQIHDSELDFGGWILELDFLELGILVFWSLNIDL